MFDTAPIVWLQSWASPALTAAMNGVSLLGYTPACVAIAAVLAFAFRIRAAVALLVLLALTAVATDFAKAALHSPRPDGEAADVQALSVFAPGSDAAIAVKDTYGFPSGHVSTATAFAVGLTVLLGGPRRGWMLAAAWIALMALSRMYLGRHFLGDVLGGVLLGAIAAAVGFTLLKLGHLARGLGAHERWPAERVLAIAIACAGATLVVGVPDARDAGRLLGLSLGILPLLKRDPFEIALTPGGRAILLAGAIVGFAVGWLVMRLVMDAADASTLRAMRLAASALPSAAMLIVPAYLPRRLLQAGSIPPAL